MSSDEAIGCLEQQVCFDEGAIQIDHKNRFFAGVQRVVVDISLVFILVLGDIAGAKAASCIRTFQENY